MADEAFRVLDVDRSGTISKAEYGVPTHSRLLDALSPQAQFNACLQALGFSKRTAAKHWKKLDPDRRGQVSFSVTISHKHSESACIAA